jgi:hypothetical protein
LDLAVPSNLVGLLLFVVLLAPGFVHVLRREAERPQRPISAFRETVLLALVSVTCDLAVLGLVVPARLLIPQLTPDVDALIRDPGGYARGHYTLIIVWGLALLIAACLLAVALANGELTSRAGRLARRLPGLRWLAPPPARSVQPISAWWRLFQEHNHPDARIYVGCELDDGSYVAGWLYSYTPDVPETGDRDLVLAAPLEMCPAGATESTQLERVGAIVVSARRLISLHVTYVDPVATL